MIYVYFYFVVLNVFTMLLYGIDKLAAKQGRWRVPEFKLHLLTILGGWPGAILAQRFFRHKTKKKRFRIIFYLMAIINMVFITSGFYLTQLNL
jgi:uncharacterized membrane protein YsdA (DUF1294 family)